MTVHIPQNIILAEILLCNYINTIIFWKRTVKEEKQYKWCLPEKKITVKDAEREVGIYEHNKIESITNEHYEDQNHDYRRTTAHCLNVDNGEMKVIKYFLYFGLIRNPNGDYNQKKTQTEISWEKN